MEGSGEGLDQHSSADSSLRNADVALREGEYVVPKAGLFVVLHLRKVKVRAGAPPDEFTSVVEEVKRKVEDGTGNGGVVDCYPRFVEMPPSRAEKQSHEYTLREHIAKPEHTAQSRRQGFWRACTVYRRSQSRSGGEQHRTS